MSGPIPINRRGMPKAPEIDLAMIWKLALAVFVIAVVLTSWYQVGPESVAVVRRLGKYNPPDRGPGFHFKLPFGADRVDIVPVQRQLKDEFGFKTTAAGIDSRYAGGREYERESLMLTGDLNVAIVEWTVQYRIVDPYKYKFQVRNPRQTFRYMSQAVMREVVGDRTVSEVLTIGRTELAIAVKDKLQSLVEEYQIGLRIDQVILQDVTPPDKVKPSFNGVNQAQQQKQKRISEARSEYNREVPKAKGRGRQTIEQAEGYAIDRTNRAEGDAERFRVLAAEYRKAPAITRRRIYLETMGKVLPNVGRKVIVDQRSGNLLQLLNVGEGAKLPAVPAAGGGQ